MSSRAQRRIDEPAAGFRLQEPRHLIEQNRRVSKHASSDSQLRVVVVGELLSLHAVDEPLVIPNF